MAAEFYELGAKQAPDKKPLFGDDRALIRAGLILLAVMTIWRFYIGLISHVIWEESHFVVSGEYFSLGYPDIPAGYPWIAKLITSVFGWQVWPLRIFGLLVATAIPFAVYWMAKPVVSERNAVWAAIISLVLPPVALNGTIFYPEGGLQLLLVLMLGCLLRAITSDGLKWWIWAGVCAGLGQLVHFRFLIPGLAVVVFMLANRQGRLLWTKPGPYVTAALAVVGLLPAVIYNAMEGWPAIQFHVVNRPRFDPDIGRIIAFVVQLFAITTPVFFIAMVAGGKRALVDDRAKPESLLGYAALVIFVFYVFQTLVNKKVMPHWPFMATLPLLPYVPGVLIGFVDKATTRTGRLGRTAVIATAPLLALAVGVVASIYQWQYRHSAELSHVERQNNILQNENYELLEPDIAAANARAVARFGPDIAWATTGHRTAVHIEFPGNGGQHRRIYTLREPYDDMARFVVARQDWKLDFDDLMRDRAGRGVVLMINVPDYPLHDIEKNPVLRAQYQRLCTSFEEIEPFRVVTLTPHRTEIDFYTARVRKEPLSLAAPVPCPFIPSLYIAQPQRGEFLERDTDKQFYGMAVDPIGLTRVEILLDGKVVTEAKYGIDEKSSPAPIEIGYDPNYPRVQFTYSFPKGSLVSGEHRLSLRATRTDGTTLEGAGRTVYVK
ncbi:glycosyltransferase family 39 protein [Asticcacaulis sp. AC402]|uniref:ArnT family glycosyltransferase n=1 Tax=Asticcacaulis sp. AC402 TaxID=1282361 RepID=UPI0003C3EC07|nr:glycosyltransferase family 39 protein [Asticcacaulis sp. AC402]ESQ77436.1 hypothetical protein ABAC402_01145 [Asticcacaulis sp. AC402]